jgi:hypothetical protein
MCLDDSDQLRGLDRLHQEIGKTDRRGSSFLQPRHEPRDGDHRHVRELRQRAQTGQQVEAVQVGESQIQQDQVGARRRGEMQGRGRIGGFDDLVGFGLERDPHHLAGDLVVLDDQDLHGLR